jgi:hypothetical protein
MFPVNEQAILSSKWTETLRQCSFSIQEPFPRIFVENFTEFKIMAPDKGFRAD